MESPTYTIKELAEKFSISFVGDPDIHIHGINTLKEASHRDASFCANPKYLDTMTRSKAGVICINESTRQIEGQNYLISDDPSQLFQKLISLFLPESRETNFQGIHPTAVIGDDVKIGHSVTIGPYAVIENGTVIGDETVIYPHAYIGPEVTIGNQCKIHANVTIREHSILGNRVILQPGAIIGSCGFGYAPTKEGSFTKLQQLGNVIIEDDVEIGANTTIDRARFKTTLIKKGSKIDNLVQIAHNVEIGKHCVIASQTGIAGSAIVNDHVMIGGQVGILGHTKTTSFVNIATRSGVSKDLTKPGNYRGSPAIDIHEYHKMEAHVRRIPKYVARIKKLENELTDLALKLSELSAT
jgi:UDP-3-O-[3-hydroxymyristoyl] glucosamine N-acyltransferase